MAKTQYDYDLFVIGGGSGGVRAARVAAGYGAKVALAEQDRMGGTCVIRGCVPKKFMVYASDYSSKIDEARAYGWSFSGGRHFDFGAFMANMNAEVDRLSGLYMRGQRDAGVTVFDEHAEFVGPNTLKLFNSGRMVTAEKILIAVGGTPWRPSPQELPGVEHTITSDDVFRMRKRPDRIVIAGGGYIACEFAHVFAGLGVETCLAYRGDVVLKQFDIDVRKAVHEDLQNAGVRIMTQAVFAAVEKTDDPGKPLRATMEDGRHVDADAIMMAVGRRPNIDGLGLEKAGIACGARGEIAVDAFSRTNIDHIWAIGDATRRVELTPVALREGHAFADSEFGGKPRVMDHENIATAVFTRPEVGTVGLSEQDARQMHGAIDVYKTQFTPMKAALGGKPVRILMKLVVKRDDQRIVGIHIVSPDASEMIQMVAIAVKAGVTKQQFDEVCAVHPTIGEEIVTMRTKTS